MDADSFKGGGILCSNVPPVVKAEKVKRDETVVANAVGLRFMKQEAKTDVSFICTFHVFSRTGVHDGHFTRHNCIMDYKFPVLVVGHEDQMQAFITEGKEVSSGIQQFSDFV